MSPQLDQQSDWKALIGTCPSSTSLARIANKWTVVVLIALGQGGRRFGDIRGAIDGISGKVLTETLRDLERDGLVKRHVYSEMPPRVEYELTTLGGTLHAPLQALARWADEHIAEVLAAREAYETHR